MLKLYACKTSGAKKTEADALARNLPEEFSSRIEGTKNEQLRTERVFAYALLDKLLSDIGYSKNRRLLFGEGGKPYINGLNGSFSITHTKGLSLVAFSDCGEVGADAELVSHGKEERIFDVCERFLKKYSPEPSPICKVADLTLYSVNEVGELVLRGTASEAEDVSAPVFARVVSGEESMQKKSKDIGTSSYKKSIDPLLRWVCAEATLKCDGGGFNNLCSLSDIEKKVKLYAEKLYVDGECYLIAAAENPSKR